jgi:hypothetical protein
MVPVPSDPVIRIEIPPPILYPSPEIHLEIPSPIRFLEEVNSNLFDQNSDLFELNETKIDLYFDIPPPIIYHPSIKPTVETAQITKANEACSDAESPTQKETSQDARIKSLSAKTSHANALVSFAKNVASSYY